MGYEWLALAAAFLWAIASLLSVTPARHLGTFAYSRWRMGSTFTILATMALIIASQVYFSLVMPFFQRCWDTFSLAKA